MSIATLATISRGKFELTYELVRAVGGGDMLEAEASAECNPRVTASEKQMALSAVQIALQSIYQGTTTLKWLPSSLIFIPGLYFSSAAHSKPEFDCLDIAEGRDPMCIYSTGTRLAILQWAET